jgi:hypothetical protein
MDATLNGTEAKWPNGHADAVKNRGVKQKPKARPKVVKAKPPELDIDRSTIANGHKPESGRDERKGHRKRVEIVYARDLAPVVETAERCLRALVESLAEYEDAVTNFQQRRSAGAYVRTPLYRSLDGFDSRFGDLLTELENALESLTTGFRGVWANNHLEMFDNRWLLLAERLNDGVRILLYTLLCDAKIALPSVRDELIARATTVVTLCRAGLSKPASKESDSSDD